MAIKTYLIVWFHSEGGRPSDITDRLLSMGFKPVKGNYDYVYEWGNKVSENDALVLGDKIKEVLEGSRVLFKMETVSADGDED